MGTSEVGRRRLGRDTGTSPSDDIRKPTADDAIWDNRPPATSRLGLRVGSYRVTDRRLILH